MTEVLHPSNAQWQSAQDQVAVYADAPLYSVKCVKIQPRTFFEHVVCDYPFIHLTNNWDFVPNSLSLPNVSDPLGYSDLQLLQ